MWSVECGVWSVECGVWSVECGVCGPIRIVSSPDVAFYQRTGIYIIQIIR